MRRPTGSNMKQLSKDLPGDLAAPDEQSHESLGGYETFLEGSAAEQALMKERLAEAERGIFISGEAMLEWVSSWGTDNELPPPEPDIFPPTRRT